MCLKYGKQVIINSFFFEQLYDNFLYLFKYRSPVQCSGGGRNSRAFEVNLASIGNYGDYSLHLLCMGLIPSGILLCAL